MHPLKTLPLVILLLSGVNTVASAQKKTSLLIKKYPPEQLKEDVRVLKDVTLAMHPVIGIYNSKAYYEKLFDNLMASIKDSLTEKDFRIKVKLLADELHCGHTEVLYSSEFYKEVNKLQLNFSPYIFLPVNNRVYMIANLNKKQDSAIKKGAEILKINGIGVDSMLRYSKRFISSDGYNETAKNHYLQLAFNSYVVVLFGRPDTFSIEYKDGSQVKQLKYPAFRPKTIPDLPIWPGNDSLFTRYKRAAIKFRFLDTCEKTMLMDVDRFSPRRFTKAYRRIFRKLKNRKSENLVIDLRNNGGGSLANAYRLLSYLVDTVKTQTLSTCIKNYPYQKYTRGNIWFKFTRLAYRIVGRKETVGDKDYFIYTIKPRHKNHFKGKVFVLINGGSFSASSLVAAYLKDRHRAIFIGEETGGAMEGCNAGITPYYKLPNTNLRVRMPAFRIVHDVCNSITGQGVLPDHKIEYGLKDILSKRDLELKKVKELLNLPQ